MVFKACLLAREIRQGCRQPAHINKALLARLKTQLTESESKEM